jgi:cold shock CspA family protein
MKPAIPDPRTWRPVQLRLAFQGTVVSFDERRGIGEILDDSGEALGFHCVEIHDQSRKIDEGARVTFEVVPGAGGRFEAARILKVGMFPGSLKDLES